MDADNTGDAYARILSKKYNYEVPDCVHPIRHITETWDYDLRKNIFVFDIHKSIDNDRCLYFDRQRNEIKTDAGSPDSMKASLGETHTYRWKFKLDAAFQPSINFTHIHQIKAGDGTIDTDNPLITLTPVKSSPNKLEIRFYPPYQEIADTTIKLLRVNLAPFLGEWIEAYESTKFDSSYRGTYSLQLKRLKDDSLLLNYNNTAISMWRRGITFCRPKYGIYRSLLDSNSLRDESVRFADFYLKEGTSFVLPAAPSNLTASMSSATQVNLSWTDNSSNEGQFRIDRSSNGNTWLYLATAKSGLPSYSDTGLTPATTYYYRVRAENTYGNSAYSNIIAAPQAIITASSGLNGSINPTGGVGVNFGGSQHFSIVPAVNYHVDSLIVDGVKIAPDTQYTFTNVQSNHTIHVDFGINTTTYQIIATAGANGFIIPDGIVIVSIGSNQEFVFTSNTGYDVDSVIIDGINQTPSSNYTFTNIQTNHTIYITFKKNTQIFYLNLQSGWNFISLPLDVPNPTKVELFPTAESDAFVYNSGYTRRDSLEMGIGYWLKFGAAQEVNISGIPRISDTIDVHEGWNMVGALSVPISVKNISGNVSGIITSQFYEYQNGYLANDTLRPGFGYWVKLNQSGKLIFGVNADGQNSRSVKIIPTSELPPLAPHPNQTDAVIHYTPTEFLLKQNYPNPFNPATTIRFELPADAFVRLQLFDFLGQEIETLVDEKKHAGSHEVVWNSTGYTSGIYYCRIQTTNYSNLIKMVMLK
ncbi:MAG: fibronectin type III domain-containing protein [Ignavibacteriales bacterium]|nr:fibronectin type III domain-containing protein [Ignavibacteriales bacterium]